nr:hypothetical protein [Mesorhizobium japonicum]
MQQPGVVEDLEKGPEQLEVVARYAVVVGVGPDHHVRDRTLATHGAIEAVEPDRFPRLPIKPMPGLRLELYAPGGKRCLDDPVFGALFGRQLFKPVLPFGV